MSTFPKAFLWGAASSAYQIEGCSLEDGGGASIWHTFSHTPGKIANDDHGDIACDSYHRYEEDIALLKELGGKLVVARATRDVHEKFLLRNGADEIVYPEKQIAYS